MTYPPKTKNLSLTKPGCRHGIRTLTIFEVRSALKVNKKPRKKMATTFGAEKKRSERQEKMRNAPVRTAAIETGQHTTETKKVESN